MNNIQIASKNYHPINRQNGNGVQPRFFQKNTNSIYNLINQFGTGKLKEVPPYERDSRIRDAWLQQWRLKEPLMVGIINSVVNIDANRGWSIIGGRNLVNKWSNIIKNDSANGKGWRYFAKKASLSFWTTDMGNVIGTKRDEPFAIAAEQNGEIIINKMPLVSLENIDPAKCYLHNKEIDLSEQPEGFIFPVQSKLQYKTTPLMPWDYFRVASMISDSEELNNLGFCALSRALEFTRIMFALWQHDLEQMDAVMPKGLLLLAGIEQNQWDTAMEQRKEDLSARERQFYGGLQVLTGMSQDTGVDAKVLALSSLPSGFDLETQTNTMMAGYALCFGYDPREFWPMSQGALGTGRETEAQAEKATSKGQGDWALSFQENLQRELPSTIHFEFQERNEAGELLSAQVDQANADVLKTMSEIGAKTPLFTNDQLMQKAIELGLADPEWTIGQEPVEATDEKDVDRMRLLEMPKIRAACELYQNEPIVQYQYRYGQPDKIIELWPSGVSAVGRKNWAVNRVLYQGDDWQLTEDDLK